MGTTAGQRRRRRRATSLNGMDEESKQKWIAAQSSRVMAERYKLLEARNTIDNVGNGLDSGMVVLMTVQVVALALVDRHEAAGAATVGCPRPGSQLEPSRGHLVAERDGWRWSRPRGCALLPPVGLAGLLLSAKRSAGSAIVRLRHSERTPTTTLFLHGDRSGGGGIPSGAGRRAGRRPDPPQKRQGLVVESLHRMASPAALAEESASLASAVHGSRCPRSCWADGTSSNRAVPVLLGEVREPIRSRSWDGSWASQRRPSAKSGRSRLGIPRPRSWQRRSTTRTATCSEPEARGGPGHPRAQTDRLVMGHEGPFRDGNARRATRG